ncbi:MAG: twin-arginine translocation signal domain-containing protein [Hyphomicrobiaceae bacterium]|nr:twin-arginine translocation signal domain-containing protein [Hyphomicrobiaceae bacterium]
MDRRGFLKSTGIAAVAGAGVAVPSVVAGGNAPAGPRRDALTVAAPWEDGTEGRGEALRALTRRWASACEGRPAIDLIFRDDALAAFRAGALDVVEVSPATLAAEYDPAFAYFAGLPSPTASDDAVLRWLVAGSGQSLLDETAERHGLKVLPSGHRGEDVRLWSRTPITAATDLAGKKISADGMMADILAALGAEVAIVPEDRLAAALATGDIDAAVGPGLLAAAALGVPRQAPHAVDLGLPRGGGIVALVLRLPAWLDLGRGGQACLSALTREALTGAMTGTAMTTALARRALAARTGVAFADAPADLRKSLPVLRDAALAARAASSPDCARIDTALFAADPSRAAMA